MSDARKRKSWLVRQHILNMLSRGKPIDHPSIARIFSLPDAEAIEEIRHAVRFYRLPVSESIGTRDGRPAFIIEQRRTEQ